MLVEGTTEVEFVKRVLAGALIDHGIVATPVSMGDYEGPHGPVTGEPVLEFRLCDVVRGLLWFPDKADLTVGRLERTVEEAVGTRLGRRYDASKVVVYVQRHEFEGLLFADVDGFRNAGLAMDEACLARLRGVRQRFPTPEDINDDSTTAPSKRILALIPDYRKRLHGPLVAEDIGLATG